MNILFTPHRRNKSQGRSCHPPCFIAVPRLGRDLVPAVLDEATKARTKGIQLKGMEFADQLSKQLLDHGSAMEGCFSDLKSAVEATSPNLDKIKALISKVQIKRDWFKKAEVGVMAQRLKHTWKNMNAGKDVFGF